MVDSASTQSSIDPLSSLNSLPPSVPLFLSLPEVITHLLPSVTLNTLRWWIQVDYEGFNTECVTRRGGRVFVIRENFLAWMMKGSKGSKSSPQSAFDSDADASAESGS
jgi:hypothetical protein